MGAPFNHDALRKESLASPRSQWRRLAFALVDCTGVNEARLGELWVDSNERFGRWRRRSGPEQLLSLVVTRCVL
jgi:hypothetical protein